MKVIVVFFVGNVTLVVVVWVTTSVMISSWGFFATCTASLVSIMMSYAASRGKSLVFSSGY